MMTRSMRSSLSRLLLVASAVAVAAGCAGNKRDTYVRERAGEHVYGIPPAELYKHATDLLKSKGYSLRENAATFQAVSEWKQDGGGSNLGTAYSRYQVTVRPVSPTSATVVYLRQNNVMAGEGVNESRTGGDRNAAGSTSNTSSRDLAMEWALLQQVDPQTAEQLQAQAAQANP
jgi:hypothetical protein